MPGLRRSGAPIFSIRVPLGPTTLSAASSKFMSLTGPLTVIVRLKALPAWDQLQPGSRMTMRTVWSAVATCGAAVLALEYLMIVVLWLEIAAAAAISAAIERSTERPTNVTMEWLRFSMQRASSGCAARESERTTDSVRYLADCCARQEAIGRGPGRAGLDQAVVLHPRAETLPLLRVLPAVRPPRGGREVRQRRLHRRGLQLGVEVAVRL